MDLLGLLRFGYENALANGSVLLVPTLCYAIAATLLAIILGWGKILFQEVNGTLVLKLPGGPLMGSLPFAEMIMLGFVLVQNPFMNEGMSLLWLGLSFFVVLRLELAALTHILVFFGSIYARGMGGYKFAIECMDERCTHGIRTGSFLHYWACGGFTLLTALGVAPLILLPVFLGLPDGGFGIAILIFCCIPYPFIIGKLLASRFTDDGQKIVKGAVDVWMFITETPGWLIGCVTMSIVALRFMLPGISPTKLNNN
ncbi:hypothetical protein KA111_02010 [Candidatus Woesebacteria bacterium]|nr:hypothetical protein [Candidatus Woesebacteria bacterium]